MSANKIDRSLLGDPRALTRFNQARPAEQEGERNARPAATTGEERGGLQPAEKLEISPSARKLEQLRDLLEAGRARLDDEMPDRAAKLETVKQRLQSGVYASTEIRNQVAGELTDLMKGLDNLLE